MFQQWRILKKVNFKSLHTLARCSTICEYPRSVTWTFSLANIQLSKSSGVYTAESDEKKNLISDNYNYPIQLIFVNHKLFFFYSLALSCLYDFSQLHKQFKIDRRSSFCLSFFVFVFLFVLMDSILLSFNFDPVYLKRFFSAIEIVQQLCS